MIESWQNPDGTPRFTGSCPPRNGPPPKFEVVESIVKPSPVGEYTRANLWPPVKTSHEPIEWTSPSARDWECHCVDTKKEAIEIIGNREVVWRARGPKWRFSARKNNG